VVRVDGMIPPGAREGDFFDVTVSSLPGNKTSSLSGGLLFESDLYRIRGSSPDLEGVEVFAKSRGPIVVNPAYALTDPSDETSGQARASLRSGMIIGGGRAMRDRPILSTCPRLKLRLGLHSPSNCGEITTSIPSWSFRLRSRQRCCAPRRRGVQSSSRMGSRFPSRRG
jgi:flagellar basal body P-ring protein FlgI